MSPIASAEAAGRAIATLRETLGPRLIAADEPAPGRLWVTIEPAATVAAIEALLERLAARYVISVGLDRRRHGQPEGGDGGAGNGGGARGFEVLHMLALDHAHLRIAVRVPLPAEAPRLPSITPLVCGAAWAEQEIRDLFGIEPEGHPDGRRLVLPDGFPRDLHPLRKDFPYDFKPPPDPTARFEPLPPPPGSTVLPLGPFFPVLEEPSFWRLFVDGETVVGADYRGFFNHRAIEKLGDSVLTYNQVVSLAERVCGICGCVHATAYCQAVEEAVGIEAPLRARLIRTLILELERLQSHLLWLGIAGHIVGFDWIFMQSWKLREPILWLAEFLTGSRKHFSCNLVGGVSLEVPRTRHARILDVLATVERETLELVRALQDDDGLIARLKGVGRLTPDEARSFGAVGPVARGSGLALDARRDHPYAAYDLMRFDVVTHDGCDNWSRTLVRLGECFESVRIMRQCVEQLAALPEGGLVAGMPGRLPALREGVSAVEAARGEAFHYVMTGERNGPDRWRVRAPSYQNLQTVPAMLKPGTTVADVPITLGSVDPCFSCTERMEIVQTRDGARRVWTHRELLERSRRGAAGAAQESVAGGGPGAGEVP
jgi:Ni,Fe-hydrogenase III large subunit/NADH:ubiquinone oxidoreductase subunit C